MKTKRHYYLMISCPGDVITERNLLKDCVDTINAERTDDIWVELQYWVTDTSSDAGMPAQDSINEQLVNNSDGLIAIFNARLGTPVHDYKCGTDEEIALMLKAQKHVSLIFNTKPIIDLSNPTSIDQITKLQEYKSEQQAKAYYREFHDENSFKTLVRREILLWLRQFEHDNLEKREDTSQSSQNTSSTSQAEQPTELNLQLFSPDSPADSIDDQAGTLDCVIYIADAATTMTSEINKFAACANELNELTIIYNDKLTFIKKQSSNGNGILLLCKQFANEIDNNVNRTTEIVNTIESKWNEVYRYLLVMDSAILTDEDRVIMKDSIISLKDCFEQATPQMDVLISTFTSVPNVQKELKKAVGRLSNTYNRFKSFIVTATQNCDEIIAHFEAN